MNRDEVKAMIDLSNVRVGDTLVQVNPRSNALWWSTVTRVTTKCVTVGAGANFCKDGTPFSRFDRGTILRHPTDEEWEQRLAQLREQEDERKRREVYMNRDDVRIACGLASQDVESWVKLGIDKLRQVRAMLDEVA